MLLLAASGMIPEEPPPRPPEPTPEEIKALTNQCADAGIDILALGQRSGGDPREFVRLATIELAARDLATAGVLDVAGARDVLEHASSLPDETRFNMLSRLNVPTVDHRPVVLPASGKGRVGVLKVNHGPGLQLREERERVGEPLRILAAYTHMTVVELGEIERGLRVPTSQQWAALQDALPDLGPMEAPPTEAERSPVLTVGDRKAAMRGSLRPGWTAPALARDLRREVDAARLERLLHPAGRCTCGVGGFGGTCDWCVMDRRRMLREARHVRRTERDQDEPRRDVVLASMSESERKAKHRKARAKEKARRGW